MNSVVVMNLQRIIIWIKKRLKRDFFFNVKWVSAPFQTVPDSHWRTRDVWGAGADNQKATWCMQGGTITQRDIFIVKRGHHVKNGPALVPTSKEMISVVSTASRWPKMKKKVVISPFASMYSLAESFDDKIRLSCLYCKYKATSAISYYAAHYQDRKQEGNTWSGSVEVSN